MAVPKKYFHDHLVMLLLSINFFLAVSAILYVLISLSGDHSNGYIVQCRDCSNEFSVNRYTNGDIVGLLSFPVFAVLVLATHAMLSFRAFKIHRQLAIAILALGILLLVLTIIVSYSLLRLR